MSKISELCNQLEKEYAQLMADVEAEKVKVSKLRGDCNTKEKNLNDREALIAGKEAELAKKESEVASKFDKIRTDEEVRKEHEHTVQLEEKIAKEKLEIRDLIAENNLIMEEIHKKQTELSDEKRVYKEKIKAEIQEELKKLIK